MHSILQICQTMASEKVCLVLLAYGRQSNYSLSTASDPLGLFAVWSHSETKVTLGFYLSCHLGYIS